MWHWKIKLVLAWDSKILCSALLCSSLHLTHCEHRTSQTPSPFGEKIKVSGHIHLAGTKITQVTELTALLRVDCRHSTTVWQLHYRTGQHDTFSASTVCEHWQRMNKCILKKACHKNTLSLHHIQDTCLKTHLKLNKTHCWVYSYITVITEGSST